MHTSRSILSKDLNDPDYPLIYREEESLELSELYDTETNVGDDGLIINRTSMVDGGRPTTAIGLSSTTRQSTQLHSILKPRVVSPIISKPSTTIDENMAEYHTNLQKVISDIDAYASIISNPNLNAQDLPRLCIEELDMELYHNKFTAKKDMSATLFQQVMELRNKTSQAQNLLDTISTQSLGDKVATEECSSKHVADIARTTPIYDRLSSTIQYPTYAQNCRVMWSSSESCVLLSHIKHSSDIGTDLFVAHIDTELSRFQQDCTDKNDSNKGSIICTLTLWFEKQGNQLLLKFLSDEFLKIYRPILQGIDKNISSEPKYIMDRCSLGEFGAILGLKQSTLDNMLQLTFKDIPSHAAKEIIAMTTDVFQRFYAQLKIWGALRPVDIVFLTCYQTCPRFFASKSDKLMNFLAVQTVVEPELKLLSVKSTTLQTFPDNCLYLKLYVAQSLDAVIVRLSFQQDFDNNRALNFTAFKFSSGEAICDDDVRAILSNC